MGNDSVSSGSFFWLFFFLDTKSFGFFLSYCIQNKSNGDFLIPRSHLVLISLSVVLAKNGLNWQKVQSLGLFNHQFNNKKGCWTFCYFRLLSLKENFLYLAAYLLNTSRTCRFGLNQVWSRDQPVLISRFAPKIILIS